MILDLFQLNGRTALVTGARRGLGRGIAVGLAEAGADIACVSRSGEATETRQQVEAAGRRFLDIQVDLADPDARAGLADRVADELGPVDILVNTAGGGGRHPPSTTPGISGEYSSTAFPPTGRPTCPRPCHCGVARNSPWRIA